MHLQKRLKRQKIPGSARSAAGRPILYGNYNIFRKVLSILFREKSGRCRSKKKSPRSCRGEASVEAVGLDFSDHIQNRAVPGFHHGDNLVLPLQGVRGADQVVSLFLEALNADCGNASDIQTFLDIRPQGVYGNAMSVTRTSTQSPGVVTVTTSLHTVAMRPRIRGVTMMQHLEPAAVSG